jgi:peptidoglycan/xylan/chitin deacetylase (PgdA/CDA1 family)
MEDRCGVTGERPIPRALEPLRPAVRSVRRRGRRVRQAATPAGIAHARTRLRTPGVALTFDDGPDPYFTHQVLDVLAEHAVPATFFIVGRPAMRHPEILSRLVAEGHEVASHSMTHPDPFGTATHQLWRDYRDGHDAVSQLLGSEVRWFRPPKGHLDRRTAALLRIEGIRTHLWTIHAADWEPDLVPEEVPVRLGASRPGDVVLLHDAIQDAWAPSAHDRSAMVVGLRAWLATERQRGTTFVALP